MHVHGRPGQTCLQEAGLGGPQSQRGLWNSIVWGPGFAFRLSPGCLNPEVVLGYIGGAQCFQTKPTRILASILQSIYSVLEVCAVF